MKKRWNYFFYSTWLLQSVFGKMIIEKPLEYFFSKIPFLHNNWTKGRKEYDRLVHSKNNSMNIGFAFGFMFLSTLIIYSCLCLFVVNFCGVTIGENIYLYFYSIVILSYMTNYVFIYRLNAYKQYFNEFKSIEPKSKIYVSAILFHGTIILIGVLTAYLTIGFNF